MILDIPALVQRVMHTDQGDSDLDLTLGLTEYNALSKPTILVVDDSITVRKVTQRLLERHGYRVHSAKDGMDALSQLTDIQPHLILLDIEMPKMDGFELASHLRHNPKLSAIPIIMITSRTGDKHRQRAKELGVRHFMGKPFQETELLAQVDKYIGG